jgi:OOP family OmpA-OmpF porin
MRKLLVVALGAALFAQAGFAQEVFDDRWMVTPTVGGVFTDEKRETDNALLLGVGIGRFLNSRVHLEVDLSRWDADLSRRSGSWESQDLGLTGRVLLGDVAREGWKPYVLGSLRHIRSEVDRPNGTSPSTNSLGLHFGAGLMTTLNERMSFRGEVAYRYDNDDENVVNQDDFSDWLATAGLSFAIGEASAPPAVSEQVEEMGEPKTMEAPVEPPVNDDNDGDGVKNDADQCPTTPPNTMVDRSSGCEVAEVIDLRGVNFDFDKCTLRPDAISILNNAVEVLKNHQLTVSVEGHTDAVGTDAYNERLSDCRAKVVYDYLLNNGVANERISGYKGFGESSPIDTNDTAEGRANNRRTELKKQ